MKIKITPSHVVSTAIMFYATLGLVKADSLASITTTETTISQPSVVVTQDPGSIAYFYTVSPSVLVTTLSGRRQDIERRLDQAHDKGQMSDAQWQAMKHELKRIANATKTDTITYPMALMLAQDLDFIGQQYGTVISIEPNYVPIISGSRFRISTGQTVQLDDLSRRRADLEITISRDLLQGRLSESRASELREQLASVGNEANLYLADGSFNAKESRRLYDAFDRIAKEIEKSAGKDKGQ